MILRFLVTFVMALTAASTIVGQERQLQILEEIQVIPEDMQGEWTIGGYQFVSDENTTIVPTHPATIGVLATVGFYVRDGVAYATAINPQQTNAADLDDGPYVFWLDETTAEVVTLVDGEVQRKTYRNLTEPLEITDLNSLESTILLDSTAPTPPASSWEAPSRLLAISDLEGNYISAKRFLQNNGVIDKDGHWDWKDGHLVLIGDLVDRGEMVTELMWLLRRLQREAEQAGGQVHYVLGNHEAMVMAGDLRYVHPKYFFVCGRIRMSYDQLYGPTSEIGRWWRAQNAVLRIGDLLFVHGGYSPILDQAKIDMNTLNQRVRDGLHPAIPTGLTPATNPVGHTHGPFWYRGYFAAYAAGWDGLATEEEINSILRRHQVNHIVIGHTVVPQVGPLDATGSVIAIDVKWKDAEKGQGLLMENGQLWRVDMNAQREKLILGNQ